MGERGRAIEASTLPVAKRGRKRCWAAICEHLTAALRGRSIREIARGVRLSEPQRVAVYALATSSRRLELSRPRAEEPRSAGKFTQPAQVGGAARRLEARGAP
jgi:hypothetical protein